MKKKIYIQILGVIACLAVVAMHVNGCFWQFSYDRYWITANIIAVSYTHLTLPTN